MMFINGGNSMAKKPEYIKRYEAMKKSSPDFFNSDYEEYEALVIKTDTLEL